MLQSTYMPSVVDIFGTKIICRDCDDAAKAIAKAVLHPKTTPILLAHINVHSLRSISSNSNLRERLSNGACLLLEGIGLKVACLLTVGWFPPDTNGTDLFPAVIRELRDSPCRLFLLGGEPEVGALAKAHIESIWPHVEVVGYKHGFFSKAELPTIRDQVSFARPNILLVGVGSPEQEALLLEFLQTPNLQLVWAVGGLFDRLSGRIPRAPSAMLVLRLEWLFRIFLEPRRLGLRYLLDALWLAKACVNEWLNALTMGDRN
jgi:exopolysaccharide biosynthesis WecB/TagA/CpsF family protein